MIKYTLFFSLVLTTFISLAQIRQDYRFEKDDNYGGDEVMVIPMQYGGIGILHETDKYKDGNRTWNFVHLDTALQENIKLSFQINSRRSYTGYEYSKDEIHLLFSKSEINGELFILTIKLSTGELTEYEIKPELNLRLTHFSRTRDNFIFGGLVNLEPCVLHYNTKQRSLKIIPGFFKKDTDLIDLTVNVNQTFNTVIVERGTGDNRKMIFRTYDPMGVLLFENLTTISDKIGIHSGVSSKLKNEDLMVVGSWGKRTSLISNGFYTLTINPFEEDSLTQICFGELEHYLDYLRPRRAAIIKQKTKTAIQRKKIPEYNAYINPFKIIEHTKGFLLLAESFSPSSSTYQPSYGYYPNSYQSNYYPYGSYYPYSPQYTPTTYGNNIRRDQEIRKVHTVAINFNSKGVPQWDYSFKFSDVRRENIAQLSEVGLTQDSLFLLYKKKYNIQAKAFNLSDQQSAEHKIKLIGLYEGDEIRTDRNQNEGLIHWFDNTFFIWGYQNIRNKKRTPRMREVFYINKFSVN